MMHHTAEQGEMRSRSFKKGLKWTTASTSCGGNAARQGAVAAQSPSAGDRQASSLVSNVSVPFDRTELLDVVSF